MDFSIIKQIFCRCSLLEDNEILPADNVPTLLVEETQTSQDVIKEELPLPDIVIPDADDADNDSQPVALSPDDEGIDVKGIYFDKSREK